MVAHDLQPGAGVVLCAEDRDGREVRDLPEKQHAEEQEPAEPHGAGHRGPAEERRDRARHRAHEEREVRVALEGRIDGDVADERHEAEQPGRRVDEKEQRRGDDAERDAECERDVRRHAPGGQRAVARPHHEGVDVALPPHVERVRGADDERRADERQRERRSTGPARREPRARGLRQQDERGDAGLGERNEVAQEG